MVWVCLLEMLSKTSTVPFASPVRNNRWPSTSLAKWSKSPSRNAGNGILPTNCKDESFSAADANTDAMNKSTTTQIERCFLISQPPESSSNEPIPEICAFRRPSEELIWPLLSPLRFGNIRQGPWCLRYLCELL